MSCRYSIRFDMTMGEFLTNRAFFEFRSMFKPRPILAANLLCEATLASGLAGKVIKLRHRKPTGVMSLSSYSLNHVSLRQSNEEIFEVKQCVKLNHIVCKGCTFDWTQGSCAQNARITLYIVANDSGHWVNFDLVQVLGHVFGPQQLRAARILVNDEKSGRMFAVIFNLTSLRLGLVGVHGRYGHYLILAHFAHFKLVATFVFVFEHDVRILIKIESIPRQLTSAVN